VTPTEAGPYAFHLFADDCATLFFGGERLLDSCAADVGVGCVDCMEYPGRYRRATITLLKGVAYPLELQCFETVGKAVCKLHWSTGQVHSH